MATPPRKNPSPAEIGHPILRELPERDQQLLFGRLSRSFGVSRYYELLPKFNPVVIIVSEIQRLDSPLHKVQRRSLHDRQSSDLEVLVGHFWEWLNY